MALAPEKLFSEGVETAALEALASPCPPARAGGDVTSGTERRGGPARGGPNRRSEEFGSLARGALMTESADIPAQY
ncbi:hypothetical protein H920_06662 [Fukomys damarensis]|uniref:Uncharacterized protein n=1 Tax=Fukomys damarensis TaxID=885580 RepID=A0A091E9M9_FUKDA|nr:hypothetical protein H920_06662 [Fukomys damarensis]